MTNGHYAVWLEFAEPVAGTLTGQRVFDVSAEGATVLDNYDIVADAGAAQWATAKTFDVAVVDGKLDLAFKGEFGDALVSAIAIVPADILAGALPYTGVSSFSDAKKQQATETAWIVQSSKNLARLGLGIQSYANDHRGKYPVDLAGLMSTTGSFLGYTTFASPRAASALSLPRGELSLLEQVAWVDASRDYVYVGAILNWTAGSSKWLMYENPERVAGDKLNVLFADGHVEYLDRAVVVARHGGAGVATPFVRPVDVASDSKVVASGENLRQIGRAMFTYANEMKQKFPPDFGTLYAALDVPVQTFVNPRGTTAPPPSDASTDQTIAWINASADYVLRAASKVASRFTADDVIAYENPSAMATGIHLLFGDGHVEFREMRWALETLGRPKPK